MQQHIGVKTYGLTRYLSRVFPARYLESNRSGFFRFGMLADYRRSEGSGRFSDDAEGLRQRGFRNNSGASVTIPEFGIHNCVFTGGGVADVMIEHSVDTPVACLSRGSYVPERFSEFSRRDADLKDAAFVVYDSHKLLFALCIELARPEWFEHPDESGIVGRAVSYESRLTMEDLHAAHVFSQTHDDVTKAVWTKPERFRHEDEFRLALFGPGLPRVHDVAVKREILLPESKLIADSIVDCGLAVTATG